MGKLLEEMILQRLQGHMVRESGLSENQFSFRKGRSTVDVIQASWNAEHTLFVRTDDGRVVRDFKLEPTARGV